MATGETKQAFTKEDLAHFEFDYTVFDLYTGVEKELRDSLHNLAEGVGMPNLKGPFFAMTHELAQNGLKALYKRVYYKFFLEEIGLDDVPYEEWLQLFKTEIESHQAENFARVCRDKNMFVRVRGYIIQDFYRMEIVNQGAPSEIEFKRLSAIIERARRQTGASFIFEGEENEDGQKEGGGLGITLIVMSLRSLGIDPDNFQIQVAGDTTTARIDIPISVLLPQAVDGETAQKKNAV